MERSSKHGPRVDDALRDETEAIVRSGHEPRVEEWREAEPAGEDQPVPDTRLSGGLRGADPYPETSPDELEGRSELARALGKEIWPANRQQLEERARQSNAPDAVLRDLRSLPDGQEFENVQAVWRALGHAGETQRF